MKSLLLAVDGLSIAIIVVAAIIVLLFLYGSAVTSHYQFLNSRNRWRKSDVEMTGGELAKSILDNYGLVDVELKKGAFNHYNYKKKRMTLSWRVFGKNNLSAHAIVMQLCTMAIMYEKEDKHVPKFEQVTSLGFFSALLIFGALITGIAYAAGAAGIGMATLVILIVAFILYLASFIISLMNVKNQKYVNAEVEKLMVSLSIFTEEDQKMIQKINKAYLQYRVVECLMTFFYTIYYILRIIGLLFKMVGKK